MLRNLRVPSARVTGEWDIDADADRREFTAIANDGIISSAAIIQGLASAGATGAEAAIGVAALILGGMITTAGGQLGEATAERNSQLAIVESEMERLRQSPQEEFDELVGLYEAKGLSRETALRVARELSDIDPLAAQLDAEFDLDDIPSRWWPWRFAARGALAFLVGSLGPLLILLAIPGWARGEVTVGAVAVSLAVSAYLGSRSEHTSAWISIARTLLIGFSVLGVSALAGSLVTF